jgi:transcriptional regulator with XRE-family HTH domain
MGVSMPSTLQIAIGRASENFCSLHHARNGAILHAANMDDETKNGGPNHLQAWRMFRRTSQMELAERAGTTGAVISLLESGERQLSAKWLRRLAPLLGTTPGYLLDYDPNDLPTSILEIWGAADESQQQQILKVAEALTGFTPSPGGDPLDQLAAVTANLKRRPRR